MKTLAVLVLLTLPLYAEQKSIVKTEKTFYWQQMGRNEVYKKYEQNMIYAPKVLARGSPSYNPKAVRIYVPYRDTRPRYSVKTK